MKTRIITALVLFPLFVLFLALGGVWLKILILGLSLIGFREICVALSGKDLPVHIVGYVFASAYILTLDTDFGFVIPLFVLISLIALVFTHRQTSPGDIAAMLFAFFYMPYLLSHICLVRDYPEYGAYCIALVFICAWATDTGAYFVGVNLGKHKLIPGLSPKKTWEGSVGGAVTASVFAFFYALVLYAYLEQPFWFVWFFPLAGAIGSVLAQIGDLAASAVKRYAGIKDFGNILPGHGGITDRFDSVLFSAPFVYLALQAVVKLAGE